MNPSIFGDQVAFRQVLNWAVKTGHIETSPCPKEQCECVTVKTVNKGFRDVTLADVTKLSDALAAAGEERCRNLLWAMFYYGARAASWRRAWTCDPRDRSVTWPGASMKNGKDHSLSLQRGTPEELDRRFAHVLYLRDHGVPCEDTWHEKFNEARVAAKVQLRAHDIRAGCAQRLEAEGVKLSEIMQILCWTQFSVARRYLRTQKSYAV